MSWSGTRAAPRLTIGVSLAHGSAMALVATLAGPERPAALALLGALGAAIALIKINVGAIALIAALAAALATDGGRWARRPRRAVEVAILCLPALLLASGNLLVLLVVFAQSRGMSLGGIEAVVEDTA